VGNGSVAANRFWSPPRAAFRPAQVGSLWHTGWSKTSRQSTRGILDHSDWIGKLHVWDEEGEDNYEEPEEGSAAPPKRGWHLICENLRKVTGLSSTLPRGGRQGRDCYWRSGIFVLLTCVLPLP
jgi:hypothetical protein